MKRGLFVLLGLGLCQVKVLAPSTLALRFTSGDLRSPNGIIEGSTATFGAPTYGESLIGRLVYFPDSGDYCDDTPEYNTALNKARKQVSTSDGVQNVFLLARGTCTFVQKVYLAQSKGAAAVLMVDSPDSSWDRHKLSRIIVADDGMGARVRIPSVLLTREDGSALMDAAKELIVANGQLPLVELEWSLPEADMVTVDFWTSNVSPVGPQFLTAFAPAGDALGPLLDFRLHFFVVEMPASTAREDIAAQCYRADRRYCTPALETEGAVKGSTVLEESVRQLCLLNGKSMTKVWWRYLEDFSNTCAARTVAWEQCSYAILKQLGAYEQVKNCAESPTRPIRLLEEQKRAKAWSPLALRINGAKYMGSLDPNLVLKAICSSYRDTPAACTKLLMVSGRESGWSTGDILFLFLVVIGIFSVGVFLYQRHVVQSVRTSLRHEVMMEVRSQMMDYAELREMR